jgi:hypothetical protein
MSTNETGREGFQASLYNISSQESKDLQCLRYHYMGEDL